MMLLLATLLCYYMKLSATTDWDCCLHQCIHIARFLAAAKCRSQSAPYKHSHVLASRCHNRLCFIDGSVR